MRPARCHCREFEVFAAAVAIDSVSVDGAGGIDDVGGVVAAVGNPLIMTLLVSSSSSMLLLLPKSGQSLRRVGWVCVGMHQRVRVMVRRK